MKQSRASTKAEVKDTKKMAEDENRAKRGKEKSMVSWRETVQSYVSRVRQRYRSNCLKDGSSASPVFLQQLAASIAEDRVPAKLFLQASGVRSRDQASVSSEPFVRTLRMTRYVFAERVYVWHVFMNYENVSTLANMLSQFFYPYKHVELLDCLLEPQSVYRLVRDVTNYIALRTLVLDHNPFKDAGCEQLCAGLMLNERITTLSLNYCELGVYSGRLLADAVPNTCIMALYLDGNNLQCEGAMDLIRPFADQATIDAEKQAEAAEAAAAADEYVFTDKQGQGQGQGQAGEEKATMDKKDKKAITKKKRKRRKKDGKPAAMAAKKEPGRAIIARLRLADNGIDGFHTSPGNNREALIQFLQLCTPLLSKMECLQELDLRRNLIGDFGALLILDALRQREEGNLPAVSLSTTHRMSTANYRQLQVALGGKTKRRR